MSFQRFLSLVEALRQSPSYPEMDPIEERMLNAMAAAWHAAGVAGLWPKDLPAPISRALAALADGLGLDDAALARWGIVANNA